MRHYPQATRFFAVAFVLTGLLASAARAIEITGSSLPAETTLQIQTGSVSFQVDVRGTTERNDTTYPYLVYVNGTDIYGNQVYLPAGSGSVTVRGQINETINAGGAAAQAVLQPFGVAAVQVTAPGSGYTTSPAVTITGGGGTGAIATATVSGGQVTGIAVTQPGTGYTSAPTVTITGGGGTGATATTVLGAGVAAINVTSGGANYSAAPTVTLSLPPTALNGVRATATATVSAGQVTAIAVDNSGSNYTNAPTVTLTGGGSTQINQQATSARISGTWVVPNDGTLHNVTGGYRLIVAIYNPGSAPTDLLGLETNLALPQQRSGRLAIDVLPDLAIGNPGTTYGAGSYRGGDIIQFNNTWRNDGIGEGNRESRPLRRAIEDRYVVDHRLTTNPEFGDANNDDFLLSRILFTGDVPFIPNGSSTIRKVTVAGTPSAVPPHGLTGITGSARDYTPQPDDGFLDIGEQVTIAIEQMIPENYSGSYFVAIRSSMSDSEEDASSINNTFVSNAANKIAILETDSPTTEPTSVVSTDNGTFVKNGDAASDYSSTSEDGDLIAFASRARDLLVPPQYAAMFVLSHGADGNMSDPALYPVDNALTIAAGSSLTYAMVEPYLTMGQQVFIKYRQTRELVLASSNAGGSEANADCYNPSISADARYVAFDSVATNILPNEATGLRSMIYVFDRQNLTTAIVSRDSLGQLADGDCFNPQLSQSGRFVVFESKARNLDPARPIPVSNQAAQIYLHDRDSDADGVFDEPGNIKTFLVSVNNAGTVANAACANPAINLEDTAAQISANGGMLVAFTSYAANMPLGTGYAMVYRVAVDPVTGALVSSVTPVSVNNLGAAPEAIGVDPVGAFIQPYADDAAVNGDGSQIAFVSAANNFVYNPTDGTYTPTFPNNQPNNPAAPVDPNVIPAGDYNRVPDVFVRDFDAGQTVRVSVSQPRVATGTITFATPAYRPSPSPGGPGTPPGNLPVTQPAAGEEITISDGATSVTFAFGTDVLIGATVFETRDNLVNAINSSGLNIVAYASNPPSFLVPLTYPGTGYIPSIFLRNLIPGEAGNRAIVTDSLSLVVVGMRNGGTQADDDSLVPGFPEFPPIQGVPMGSNQPSIDRSGRFVAFRSIATNLDVHVATEENSFPTSPVTGELIRPLIFPTSNVYLHDRQADSTPASGFDAPLNNTTSRVSVSKFGYKTAISGADEDGVDSATSANNSRPAISANGRFVSFSSDSTGEGGLIFGPNNLTPLDNRNTRDVFIYDRRTSGPNPPPPATRPEVVLKSPSPSIIKVSAGTTLPLSASAVATPGKFISSVQFFVNGVAVGSVLQSEPYTVTYRFANPGEYTVLVVATDSRGINSSDSRRITVGEPVGSAPTIAVTQPQSQVSNFVALSDLVFNAVAQDSDGTVDKVSFWFGGVEIEAEKGFDNNWYPKTPNRPYRPSVPGTYTFLATAADNQGNTTVTDIGTINVFGAGATFPTAQIVENNDGLPFVAGGVYPLRAKVTNPIPGLVFDQLNSAVLFYGNDVFLGVGLLQADGTYLLNWNVPTTPRSYRIEAYLSAPNRVISADPLQYANSLTKALNPLSGPFIRDSIAGTGLSVVLTKPANNAQVAPGVPVLLEATAEAPPGQGTISKVEFYQNGNLITFLDPASGGATGEDTSFPYQINFTPPSAGQYKLTAVAYSTAGRVTASTAVTITAAIGAAPSVSITSPSDLDEVTPGLPVTVTVNASDSDGSVAQVELLVNGVVVGVSTQAPFVFTDGGQFAVGTNTTFTPSSEGVYAIVARAKDNLGNVTDSLPVTVTAKTATPVGLPPTVQVTQPVGEVYYVTGSSFFLNARATDVAPGQVDPSSVKFSVNGLPVPGLIGRIGKDYGVRYTPTNVFGIDSIKAQATDNDGNTAISTANFTVLSVPFARMPEVEMLPLLPGARPDAGGVVRLRAIANIPPAFGAPFSEENNESRVEFYANGVYLGTATEVENDPTAPAGWELHTLDWTAPSDAGSYTIEARVVSRNWTTNTGEGNVNSFFASVISEEPLVVNTLAGAAPTVAITAPADTSAAPVNVPFVIRAAASVATGSVAQVQFYVNGALASVGSVDPATGAVTPDPNNPNPDTTFPYQLTYTPTSQGPHVLYAIAVSSTGLKSVSPAITVNVVSGSAPTVDFTVNGNNRGVSVLNPDLSVRRSGSNMVFYFERLSGVTYVVEETPSLESGLWTPNPSMNIQRASVQPAGLPAGYELVEFSVPRSKVRSMFYRLSYPNTAGGKDAAQINEPLVLAANATDSDGSVVSVTFLANGVPLPTITGNPPPPDTTNPDTVAPYRYNFTPTAPGRYEIVARAIDNLGNVTDSAPWVLNIGNGQAPTVSITSPATGIVLPQTTLNIRWAANDADGSVQQIDFLVNGAITQSFLSSAGPVGSGSVVFVPPSQGSYSFVVRATDNLLNVTDSQPVVVTVDNTAPDTLPDVVLSPQTIAEGNYVVGSEIFLNANALAKGANTIPNDGVTFYANGLPLGGSFTGLTNGAGKIFSTLAQLTVARRYDLEAEVTDSAGGTAVDARSINAEAPLIPFPQVDMIPLQPGTVLAAGGRVKLMARAAFPAPAPQDGQNNPLNERVEFYVNGAYVGAGTNSSNTVLGPGVFEFDWRTPAQSSSFRIHARAVSINIGANALRPAAFASVISDTFESFTTGTAALPVVSIKSPLAGTSVPVGQAITLQASASIVNSTIARVDYYANGAFVGSSATAADSYSVTLTPTSKGELTLIAVAVSTQGFENQSAPVKINVPLVGDPAIALSYPAESRTQPGFAEAVYVPGTTFSALAEVALNPNLQAPIKDVRFFLNEVLVGEPVTVAPYSQFITLPSEGDYFLKAVATDIYGNTAAVQRVVRSRTPAGGGAAPIVSVVHPVPGGNGDVINDFSGPSQLYLNANVVLPAGTTAGAGNVQFFANGKPVAGTVTVLPTSNGGNFGIFWQPERLGEYNITAQVTDSRGSTAVSEALFFTIDPVARPMPSVTLLPLASKKVTVGSPVFLQVVTNGGLEPVARVDFYANQIYIGSQEPEFASNRDVTSVFSWTPPAPGIYKLSARAIQVLGEADNSVITPTQDVEVIAANGQLPIININEATLTGGNFVVGSQLFLNATAQARGGATIPTGGVSFYFADDVLPAVRSGVLLGAQPVYSAPVEVEPRPGSNLTGSSSVLGFATVRDSNDNISSSEATDIGVNRPRTPLPTVRLLPVQGSTQFTAGGTVQLRARASFDVSDALQRVEFYANGAYLGEAQANTDPATQSIFTHFLNWETPSAGGAFQITARAVKQNFIEIIVQIDADNNRTEIRIPWWGSAFSPEVETVNTLPGSAPVIQITQPSATAGNLPVNVPITIGADASVAGSSIREVRFFVNGLLYQPPGDSPANPNPDTTFPYSVVFTPTSPGLYNIDAVAVSAAGLVGTSTVRQINVVAGLPPVISFFAPDVLPLGGVAELTAQASIPAGQLGRSITKVEFLANNVVIGTDEAFPYEFDWTVSAPGNYELQARAYDNAGNVTSSTILSRTTAVVPTVTLVARDLNGAPVTSGLIGQVVVLTATATTAQPGVGIANVEFAYENGQLIDPLPSPDVAGRPNPQTTAPYTYQLKLDRSGEIKLIAIATDNSTFGLEGVSNVVTITVADDPGAPTVAFLAPENGALLDLGSPVVLEAFAQAADDAGTITKVEFTVTSPNGQSLVIPGVASGDTGTFVGTYSSVSQLGIYTFRAKAFSSTGKTAEAVVVAEAKDPFPPIVPGTNGAFIFDMYEQLLYRLPTIQEFNGWIALLGPANLLAPLAERADMVMQMMGYNASTGGFDDLGMETAYQRNAGAALQPYGRLGLAPTLAGIVQACGLIAGNTTPLPITSYALAGAPYGSTYGMGAAVQQAFNTPAFQTAYPGATALSNYNFAGNPTLGANPGWLATVMFKTSDLGDGISVVQMMDSFTPSSNRQGAAAAFYSRLLTQVLSGPNASLNPQLAAAEQTFQKRQNSAALQFQLSNGAVWNFSGVQPYSPTVVQQYIQQYWDSAQ